MAAELAESLAKPGSFQLEATISQITALAREVSDADIAYCRSVGHDESLELCSEVITRNGVGQPVGVVPRIKHRGDCECPYDCISGGERRADLNVRARARKMRDGRPFYDEEAL